MLVAAMLLSVAVKSQVCASGRSDAPSACPMPSWATKDTKRGQQLECGQCVKVISGNEVGIWFGAKYRVVKLFGVAAAGDNAERVVRSMLIGKDLVAEFMPNGEASIWIGDLMVNEEIRNILGSE
jgi:hypothetical protein